MAILDLASPTALTEMWGDSGGIRGGLAREKTAQLHAHSRFERANTVSDFPRVKRAAAQAASADHV